MFDVRLRYQVIKPDKQTGQVFDDKSMKDFKKGGFDRRNRNDRGFDRGGRGFEKKMFPATCAECGDRCHVPFRPTGDKPVLCNNCFRGSGSDDHGFKLQRREERFLRDEKLARKDDNREQFEQLNAKLDLILKEIEKLKQTNKIHTVETLEGLNLSDIKQAKKIEKTEIKETTPETAIEKNPTKKVTKQVAKKAKK